MMAAWERGEIDRNQYLDAAVFYEPRDFSRDEFFDFILAQSQRVARTVRCRSWWRSRRRTAICWAR